MVPRFGLATATELRNRLARLAKDQLGWHVLRMAALAENEAQSNDFHEDLSALAIQLRAEEVYTVSGPLPGDQPRRGTKLYPSGTILHLQQMKCSVVDNSFFDEILLTDSMFSSHMPGSYMEHCTRAGHSP